MFPQPKVGLYPALSYSLKNPIDVRSGSDFQRYTVPLFNKLIGNALVGIKSYSPDIPTRERSAFEARVGD